MTTSLARPIRSPRTTLVSRSWLVQGGLVVLATSALACSGADEDTSSGAIGGATGVGGALSTGGASPGNNTVAGGALNGGGKTAFAVGGRTSAGTGSMVGGHSNLGGSSASSTGGASAGGTASKGGSKSQGGAPASGGAASGTGGAAKGGASSGGTSAKGGSAAMGGSSTGGTTSAGGSASCPFPTSYKWKSSGILAEPKSPSGHTFVSLKDFTVTKSGNQFVVYASVYDTAKSAYSGVNINFTDFAQMGSAAQTYLGNTPLGATVAPTLFYFTPKKLWVLTYQWGFKYATTTDPTKPSTWTSPKTLLNGGPSSDTGPIDQTVICDNTTCYLFFAADNGSIYRSSMPIGSFPGTFSGYTTILTDTKANLFEAVQVYSVKGTGKYLMIVEAMGASGRYFRALSATSLGGTFTPIAGASTEAAPFAGKNNVTFTGSAWTSDISHGDLVRVDPSETQTVDPCNMLLLYQGRAGSSSDYNALPYRPGLLTKTN